MDIESRSSINSRILVLLKYRQQISASPYTGQFFKLSIEHGFCFALRHCWIRRGAWHTDSEIRPCHCRNDDSDASDRSTLLRLIITHSGHEKVDVVRTCACTRQGYIEGQSMVEKRGENRLILVLNNTPEGNTDKLLRLVVWGRFTTHRPVPSGLPETSMLS